MTTTTFFFTRTQAPFFSFVPFSHGLNFVLGAAVGAAALVCEVVSWVDGDASVVLDVPAW